MSSARTSCLDHGNRAALFVAGLLMRFLAFTGTLVQIKRTLRPDGVFIGSMLGGDTLFELRCVSLRPLAAALAPARARSCCLVSADSPVLIIRTSLQLAELEREGGISPRISPMTGAFPFLTGKVRSFLTASDSHIAMLALRSSLSTQLWLHIPAYPPADSQSVTSLLNRAGFALSTVDVDEIQIAYPSIHELIDDLRWMGEGNAVVNRRRRLSPETLLAAGEIYKGAQMLVRCCCPIWPP